MAVISVAALRAYVVSRQHLSARFRRASERDVETAIRRLSAVQLDSITTVDRAHRITLGARVGAYPRDTVSRLLADGRIFEYWAHEACLLPIELYPLFRRKMAVGGRWGSYTRALREHPEWAERVLAEIAERGPLASRDFEGEGGGGMWNWKPAKRALEAQWDLGRLAIAGRQGFQRLYDLSERVIPAELLEAPVPGAEEYLRELTLRAVRARGALTEPAIREHWRLKGGASLLRPHLDALVAGGELVRLAVSDGGAPLYVPAEAELDVSVPQSGILLSPFDNLLWDRPLTRRLFGFEHVIEVYKPQPQRVYGYYVLPFLYGDRIVARADLKAERKEGVLRVRAFHVEPGVRRSGALEAAFESALSRLARTIGLEPVRTGRPVEGDGSEQLGSGSWTSRRARSTRGRRPIPPRER